MLDGLDQIDWRRLGHAYGSAGDVPGQLRALRSPDPQERQTAIGALYANIFHQGSRYEASAYALPFLLELAGDPATPDPELGLYLITALAIGYDERWLPEGFPVAEFRRAADGGRELLAAKPPPCDEDEDDEDDDEEKEYVEYEYVESLSAEDQGRLWAYIELAAYDAARAGVPLLRSLLTRPEPGVRVGAAYALAWFPEDAAGSVAALAAVRDAASDADEVATAVVASGLLGSAPDAGLLADPRPVVRWAAAVGRARVLGAETDQATVDELLAWVAASPDGSRRRPAGDGVEVPFHDGDLAGYAGLSLRLVDPRHTDRAFDALLGRLPTVTGSAALPVATEALRLAFPDGRLSEGVPPAALAPRQRRLVEVLARSPEPWQINGRTFGNFSMLVGEYGLPRSREAMLTYLGGDPA
ncbi:hypothetical protein C5N14_10835 [Micromonospora sp. MW-13]|uniref:HEAT repeat domain-containing protein n=1 Tax=Micromonospora sp. MW-13 TaxID=2094022 RepID=UPI000EEC84D7|nr:HEAT repeat domain-containing protein [Micromonospora sp. MW-13]RGC69036.1 hypothetical protein C5N14_10835 [Micromonospora sp. MW-13]